MMSVCKGCSGPGASSPAEPQANIGCSRIAIEGLTQFGTCCLAEVYRSGVDFNQPETRRGITIRATSMGRASCLRGASVSNSENTENRQSRQAIGDCVYSPHNSQRQGCRNRLPPVTLRPCREAPNRPAGQSHLSSTVWLEKLSRRSPRKPWR
jgi:hypothetical protein